MPTQREEARYWEDLLEEQRRTALKSFRDVAAKWQGTIAGLLGVFSTAAVIKGPATFKDLGLGEDESIQLVQLIAAAAVAGFAAIVCSARAAQGMPAIQRQWTGEKLRQWMQDEVRATLRWLLAGRLLTFVAATWLFIAWVGVPMTVIAHAQPAQLRALVIRADGTTVCGVLVNPAAVKVKVGDATPTPLKPDDDVKIVERCPKE